MIRTRVRIAAVFAIGASLALISGCGGGGSSSADQALPTTNATGTNAEYATALKAPLRRLGTSANRMGQVLLSSSDAADVARIRKAANSQIALVSEVQTTVSEITAPDGKEQAQRQLRKAISLERQYLGRLIRITSAEPERGISQIPAASRLGTRMVDGFRAFYRAAPAGTPRVVTDAGLLDLSGLRSALEDAKPAPAPARAPAPTPAPSSPTAGAGINFDSVANSGGEGVRYRYSPYLYDVVPGNGPFEGDSVSINCIAQGETVRGNLWWALLTNGYYVPTTYLRYSSGGPVAGARLC